MENAVGARFIEAGWDTFYWKDKKNEVDFVVLGPSGEKWAVEVKSSRPSSKDLSSLRLFCSQNPEFSPVLVCPEVTAIDDVRWRSVEQVVSLDR